MSEILPSAADIGLSTGSFDVDGFKAVGKEFLRYSQDWCKLTPAGHVLDVGSGIGRLAIPLTQYLGGGGRYEGLEILGDQVEWCQKNITTRYPNFRFQWADIHNTTYNPEGQQPPEQYRFPYDDRSFDLVLLTSVFTHMLPAGMSNYLSEISRVLKEGGHCLSTYFILNEETRALIDDPASGASYRLPYRYPERHYAVEREDRPEDVIAYYEPFLRAQYLESGLQLVEPIRYGNWSGRVPYVSHQDIVVARKA